MSDNDCVPAAGLKAFAADEVIVYGVSLRGKDGGAELSVGKDWAVRIGAGANDTEFVAAYGYAFEGHCYRFDQPKILAFRKGDVIETSDKAQGCGFSQNEAGPGYGMWRLRATADMLEMTAKVGSFDKLVLDAARGGRRPPNTYRAELQLAHRGGRLTSGGG